MPTAADVERAVEEWLWVPEDGTRLDTPDGVLVRWPGWFEHPASLVRFHPEGDPARALGRLLATARGWGVDRVQCWVGLGADAAYDDLFRAAGGAPDEVLSVLALDLGAGPPDLGERPALRLRRDTDLATHADAYRVGVEVFGGTVPSDDEVAASLARQVPEQWSVVAYAGDRPVGSGGVTLAGRVARLWGGGVVEDHRGRGVYRALLVDRLRAAHAAGCAMALVKGRIETSGPVLRRAGFEVFGEERSYLVPVG